MKRIAGLFCIAFSLFNSYNISAQTIHCLSEKSPINVDGKPDEWPQPFDYYDGGTKLQFAFANDTGSLYVCLKITDDPTQIRLFNGGLNIGIDPKGKKKEVAGIGFPMKTEKAPGTGEGGGKHKRQNDGIEDQDPRVQRSDALRLKQHAFLTQTTIRIKGFSGVPEQVLPLKNDYAINVAFNWDSLNILTIEYKFPITLILGHSLTAADTLKPISVAFIEPAIESLKLSASEEENNITGPSTGNSGMGRSNMGGMNNGLGSSMNGGAMGNRNGMGGGMSRGNMPTMNPANQEQKLWSKVVLSLQ